MATTKATKASYRSRSKWSQKGLELQALLAKAFPEHRTSDYDVFDVTWLAKKLKCSDEGIYKWFREGHLPYRRAVQIAELRGCRKKLKDILPFVA